MHISPSNPIIKKSLTDFFTKDLGFAEQVYDYDAVSYQISSVEGSDTVRFSIKTACGAELLANGTQDMLKEQYEKYLIPKDKFDEGFDQTLEFNTSEFPQTRKVDKKATVEEQEQIRKENAETRIKRDQLISDLTDQLAQFKRDFIGAPIRSRMVKAAANEEFEPCEINYRPRERYWVLCPAKGTCQVLFSVHFEKVDEAAFAKVIMLALQQSGNKVAQSIPIKWRDPKEGVPKEILEKFPNTKANDTSSGWVSMVFNADPTLKRNIDQPFTFCIGFRQYLHYHLHAIKLQLHSKMRQRVDAFERVIKKARREDEKAKTWKENFVLDQDARELKAEKKTEEALKFK